MSITQLSNKRHEKDAQLSDHSEDRAIRIGRLAHEIVGSFDAADNDDVHAEDLDVHDITCFARGTSSGCMRRTMVAHYVPARVAA